MGDRAMGAPAQTRVDEDTPRWFGEPVCVSEGSAEDIISLIPHFLRRPFSMGSFQSAREEEPDVLLPRGENRLCDLIVRQPLNETEVETPVGIVSKRYKLVQHRDLFEKACDAIKAVSIDLRKVSAELMLSIYGSKMALTFAFPQDFDFDPGDQQILKLRFHCVNSVDGRCRLRIMLGWFRFVCGNGLVVGTAQLSQRFVHNEYLDLPDLVAVLRDGLNLAEEERGLFKEWMAQTVADRRLQDWVSHSLLEKWGPLAAARTYHICTTGHDGGFANPGQKAPPHLKSMIQSVQVPGAPSKAKNAYDVCQALAWVAKTRKDIQDQLDGMMEIRDLMRALLN